MKVPALLILSLINSFFSLAQPAIQWEKSFGGTGIEYLSAIEQTSDGGFIIAGSSTSNNGDVTDHRGDSLYLDYWIVKVDSGGSIQWQKSLGGSNNDYATAIRQTNAGGYIVAGYSYSNDSDVTGHHGVGGIDYWVVKLDTAGTIQWEKSLGGTSIDIAESVDLDFDGGYLITGASYSSDGDVTGHHGGSSYPDYWVVKLDTSGIIQWQKTFGGSRDDHAFAIHQTSDSGYVIAGYSDSNDSDVTAHHGASGVSDCWIVKLDTARNIQWQKSLGGSQVDYSYSIQQTNDNGYIVAGGTYSNDGDVIGHHGNTNHNDFWVVKLDTAGAMQWQASLGGSDFDEAFSVKQTTDGGYIVAGGANSNDGNVTGHHGTTATNDCWLVKLDTGGILQWQKSFGGTAFDRFTTIQQTNDSGFIAAGWSRSDDDDVSAHHGTASTYDYWLVKLGAFVTTGIEKNNHLFSDFRISPNPFSQSTVISFFLSQRGNISVRIFDTSGKVVKTLVNTDLNRGHHRFSWNATDDSGRVAANGIYFVKIEGDGFRETRKVSVAK